VEAGGRKLVILSRDDGVSCLYISAREGHVDVVKAQLEAGGRELVMLTADMEPAASTSVRIIGIWTR